jgi:hypothetical protein
MSDLTSVPGDSNTIGEGPRIEPDSPNLLQSDEVVNSIQGYSVDDASGLVEGRRQGSFSTPIDKKAAFLELFRRFWPNVTKACSLSGLSYRTYKQHLELDSKFKQACEDIKREVLDELEGLGTKFAQSPRGFMHWIAILKAHRPERWSPDQKIVIQHELAPEQVRLKRDNLAQVIAMDAEVIEATTGRKPPELPEFRQPEPDVEVTPPDDPTQSSKDKDVAGLPPEIPEKTSTPQQETTIDDGSIAPQLLDIGADEAHTYGHDELDITALVRGRIPPPKKPTGGVISTNPQAPLPLDKADGE